MSVFFHLDDLPTVPPEDIVQDVDPDRAAVCAMIGHAFEGRVAVIPGEGVRCVGRCVQCGMGGMSAWGRE